VKIISRRLFVVPALVAASFILGIQSSAVLAAEPAQDKVLVQPGKDRVVKPGANPWGAGREAHQVVPIGTSLKDMGYKDGLVFVEQGTEHSETLYFGFPAAGNLLSGVLRFNLAPTPYLTPADRLQIKVNDKLRIAKTFGTESDKSAQVVEIPISASDITIYNGKSYIKTTLSVVMKAGSVQCPADANLCRYVNVLPDSQLQASVDYGQQYEVNGAWALLGTKVKVSLPAGQMTQSMFTSAWELGRLIRRTGRDVEFTRLPEVGDFVMLPKEAGDESLAGLQAPQIENGLNVRNLGGKVTIVIGEPFDKAFADMQGFDGIDRKVFTPIKGRDTKNDRYQVRLADMGFDESERQLSGNTTKGKWSVGIASNRLPFGYVPEGVEFQISTIDLKGSDSLMVYVYLNDFLQKSFRLEGDDTSKRLAVRFNELNISTSYNALKVIAERVDAGAPNGSYPVQLGQALMLLKREIVEVPQRFDELGLYYADGFDTYLPEAYLQDPIDALHLLSEMADDLNFKAGAGSVVFYKPDYVFKPTRPFILFGSPKVDFSYQGVHFDRGSYLVKDWGDRRLIAEKEAENLSVIQIVQQGDISGLWLAPGPACKRLPRAEAPLRQDNVALIDDAGIVLTFDGMDPKGLKLVYKNFRTWEETLAYYSFTILVVVWVFAVLFFAYVLRLVRRNEQRGEA